MNQLSFFRSRAYHIGMAAIYILAGVVMIIYSAGSDKTAVAGGLLVAYGIYRLLSRLQLKKHPNPGQ